MHKLKKYENEILTMREEFDRMWEQKRKRYSEELCSIYEVEVGDIIEYDYCDQHGRVTYSQKTLVETIHCDDYCQLENWRNDEKYWSPFKVIRGRNFLKGKTKLAKRVEEYTLGPKWDKVVQTKANKIIIELENGNRLTIIKNKNL